MIVVTQVTGSGNLDKGGAVEVENIGWLSKLMGTNILNYP